jgi:hypothetical protein
MEFHSFQFSKIFFIFPLGSTIHQAGPRGPGEMTNLSWSFPLIPFSSGQEGHGKFFANPGKMDHFPWNFFSPIHGK